MSKIINELWSKIKTHAIYILIICLLVGALSTSVNRCSNTSDEYKHNIEALKDTIKYYQDKNGNLVATKLAFESDIKTLKTLKCRLSKSLLKWKCAASVSIKSSAKDLKKWKIC